MKTETTHTPGTWVVDEESPVFRREVWVKGCDILVATIEDDNLIGTSADATARLIAASPELLAALRALVASPNDDRAINQAVNAIAKAEGR